MWDVSIVDLCMDFIIIVIKVFDENDNFLVFDFFFYNLLIFEVIFVGRELFRV